MRIIVLGAFKDELTHINGSFSDLKEVMVSKCRCLKGSWNDNEIIISLAGIGTSASAITTTILCEQLKPDLIIFCGVAGGLKLGQQVGDLVLASTIIDADLHLLPSILQDTPYKNALIDPHTLAPITAEYTVNASILAKFSSFAFEGLNTGIIVTSNTFPAPKSLFAEIKKLNCSAIEMESAGVYKAAGYYDVPVLTLRAISNLLDDAGNDLGTKSDALEICSKRLALCLTQILNHLIDPGARADNARLYFDETMFKNSQKKEAEICNQLDQLGITMYGRRIHNPDPVQGKRVSYDIHPYTKQGTGVSVTITYTDAKTKVPYILLAKKKNGNQYDQIGGYTRGQGPEGSDVSYEKRSEDERDKEEEEIIGNVDAVQVAKQHAEPTTTGSSYNLKQLKEASVEGFLQQQVSKPGKQINPIQMKGFFATQGLTYNNDYNAWDTALREAKEETGLNLNEYKPKELFTTDDFGVTNDERLHTKVTHYLFHLGTLNEAPVVKAGSDIDSLKWVAVTDIDYVNRKVINDAPIRIGYILQIATRALNKLREIELANTTNDTFIKYKSLGETNCTDPFSLEACQKHQRILAKGFFISQRLKDELASNQYESTFNL